MQAFGQNKYGNFTSLRNHSKNVVVVSGFQRKIIGIF